MIVVDTSVWIAAFRDRDTPEAHRLAVLLDDGVVALAAPVRIELLTGAARRHLDAMRRWLSALPLLVPSPDCWQRAEEWASRAARAGQRFGVTDLLIAATAAEARARVWSLDADFTRMHALGFGRLYEPPDR
jgi:predicted nucleic acid-binding protein